MCTLARKSRHNLIAIKKNLFSFWYYCIYLKHLPFSTGGSPILKFSKATYWYSVVSRRVSVLFSMYLEKFWEIDLWTLTGEQVGLKIKRLPIDQKVIGSIPGSTLLCSCHSGGSNSHMQAHEVFSLSLSQIQTLTELENT